MSMLLLNQDTKETTTREAVGTVPLADIPLD